MYTKIWVGIIVLLAITVLLIFLQISNERSARQIWHSLETLPETDQFTPALIADLPEPVQRYFLHAIQPGTPLAASVQIKMRGSFKLGQNWQPMQADEILSTQGFLWRAVVGTGLVRFWVADRYANSSGQVYVTLWNTIPIVNQQNENITRASIGRWVIEWIWLPSLLLPQRGVEWQAVDAHTITARLEVEQEPVTLTLTLDDEGRLLQVTMPRWGEDQQTFAYLPYGATVLREVTFAGYTVPGQVGVGWWFGTERYEETFQATIEQAKYDASDKLVSGTSRD